MNQSTITKVNIKELEEKVQNVYHKVALHPEESYHFEMGRALAERLGYPRKSLDKIPEQAIESFAGVGYYFDKADLQKGDTVVDLGSGSGMDVFFAANAVGPEGEVIGLDMTPAQLDKSRRLGRDRDNVFFHQSKIELLPIVTGSIDAVISNGVINLSSNKQGVFKEAARVLRTGGRLAISDIVTNTELPGSISCDASLWAACIGGAITKQSYLEMIEEAGFEIQAVTSNPYAFLSKGAQGATQDYGIESISILGTKK